MKNLLLISLIAALAACSPKSEQSSYKEMDQTVVADTLAGNYGAEITSEGANDIAEVSNLLGNQDSVKIKLTGNINKTCKMKGCWMTMAMPDSAEMRVTFKDYGFFVPKNGVEGREAVVEGYAYKTVTDVETLKHYAEDEGKSAEEIEAITEPKEEITFIASGVIIK